MDAGLVLMTGCSRGCCEDLRVVLDSTILKNVVFDQSKYPVMGES